MGRAWRIELTGEYAFMHARQHGKFHVPILSILLLSVSRLARLPETTFRKFSLSHVPLIPIHVLGDTTFV